MKAKTLIQRGVSAALLCALVFSSAPVAQAAEDWHEETAEVFALGSDGVAHDGISYLTADEFNSVSAETREAYIELCDSFSEETGSGLGPYKIEFDLVSKNNITVNEYYKPVTYDGAAVFPEGSDNAVYDADEAFYAADAVTDEYSIKEIPGQEEDSFDSLFVGDIEKSSFKKQLTANQLKIYNAGYNAVVKKNKNKFSYHGVNSGDDVCRAISALVLTYPWKFEWIDHDCGMVCSYPCHSQGMTVTVNITMYRSKWYTKKDEENAAALIDKLVDAAESYAATNTPDHPVYGMVKYMDDWLGQRADYDYSVLYQFDESAKDYYYAHNSYGVLLNGLGVCESYAKAMTRFLYEAGIPNAYAVGDAYEGGGHAWNMIYMPNGNWYIEDATYNDGGYGDTYLLCPSDGRTTDGIVYTYRNGALKYPSVARSWYDSDQNEYASDIDVRDKVALLDKGKKKTLSVTSKGGYYTKFKQNWTSSNNSVATVSNKGKITALAPGRAVITLAIAGQRRECEVLVSKTKSLTFEENGKKKLTKKVSVNDSSVTLVLDVLSVTGSPSAQVLSENGKMPTVKSSKKKVACVSGGSSAIQVKGDKIYVKLDILKKGSSTITVKYGGKTAKCTLKVKK